MSDQNVVSTESPTESNWWEWVIILAAIGSLWPTVLRWEHWAWDVVQLVFLGLMLWVFMRRLRRVKGLKRYSDTEAQAMLPPGIPPPKKRPNRKQ
ncbi:MAG: hypothetical protein QGH20_01730 [Candidatus Latescibacteria bacterium]|nr:hypothetical protein [Candidatus Latescibacterota bacterium]